MRSDIFKGQTCESFLTIGTCGLIFIVTGCGAPVGQIAARMDVSGKNLKIFRIVCTYFGYAFQIWVQRTGLPIKFTLFAYWGSGIFHCSRCGLI